MAQYKVRFHLIGCNEMVDGPVGDVNYASDDEASEWLDRFMEHIADVSGGNPNVTLTDLVRASDGKRITLRLASVAYAEAVKVSD